MIKIGDFARLSGVSVATLRHYEEEGLLSPCRIHPESGYKSPALSEWLAANHFCLEGAYREIYHSHSSTEVQYPFAPE
jgi:hypothetical protein